MTKKYDVIIVGAGPGGAMAAKTAAEIGLKAALLERKTDPALITRGCAMMFVSERDYCFAEKMYYSEKSSRIVFPVNGFSVDYDGPCRNFYAWHIYAPDGKSRVQFGDYEANRKMGDQGRLSFVFDKGYLIDGIIKAALENGAELFTGLNVEAVEKTPNGVRVVGDGEVFEAPFVIGSDGLNSRVAEVMGFNKDRKFYGTHPKLTYYATGVRQPESESLILAGLWGPGGERPTAFFLLPSVFAEDEYWFAISTPEDFDYLIRRSVYSEWFRDIEVSRHLAYVYTLREPVAEPYKDNVLLVGDSAWFAEAEITGSMMCGWKAANSVAIALNDGKPNREGVKDYIEWWRRSYPDFFDYRDFLMLFTFYNGFLTVPEMSYLFGLFKQPLHSTLNPFLIAKLIKEAAQPLMPQILKEMPSLAEKLSVLDVDNIDKILGVGK